MTPERELLHRLEVGLPEYWLRLLYPAAQINPDFIETDEQGVVRLTDIGLAALNNWLC